MVDDCDNPPPDIAPSSLHEPDSERPGHLRDSALQIRNTPPDTSIHELTSHGLDSAFHKLDDCNTFAGHIPIVSCTSSSHPERQPRNKKTANRSPSTHLAAAFLLLQIVLALFATGVSATVLPSNALHPGFNGGLDLPRPDNGVVTVTPGEAPSYPRSDDALTLSHLRRPREDPADLAIARLSTRGDFSDLSHEDALAFIRRLAQRASNIDATAETTVKFSRRANSDEKLSTGQTAAYAVCIPILVLLSGITSGLTLGYMSIDATQLEVLSTTGNEKQREYARKIMPIRKDGHLLLTTLLVANMITNETLPIVSDPLFPSPVLAVVISTILVIIFAELVPQSVCSRYGLVIGARMAVVTRVIIIILWPIAFPVSRVLHWTLGPHHGIVYRRAELKELITMHAASGGRGGDLKGDTVMMVGGALDLQEKVVSQAMTSFDKVFMLPFDAKLDYPTLQRIVRSGHSRIPIYQEVEVSASAPSGAVTPSKRRKTIFTALARRSTASSAKLLTADQGEQEKSAGVLDGSSGSASPKTDASAAAAATPTVKRKNIIGTLLVKSCVLLDPEDAVPVSDMTINPLPTVPADEPLHNVLNAFQEGRSHMAIVTSLSRNESVIDSGSLLANLTRRQTSLNVGDTGKGKHEGLSNIDEEAQLDTNAPPGSTSTTAAGNDSDSSIDTSKKLKTFWRKHFSQESTMEQGLPADAELSEKTKVDDSTPRPARGDILGIITLEDVLEELIGEEIYDEYDPHDGDEANAWNNVTPPLSPEAVTAHVSEKASGTPPPAPDAMALPPAALSTDSQMSPPAMAHQQSSKTFLGRLGFGSKARGGGGSGVSSPSPATHDVAPSSPVLASPEPIAVGEMVASPLIASTADSDYFTVKAESQPTEDDARAAPTLAPPSRHGMPASSRPTTPALGAHQTDTAVAMPQPNRPVVLRKTLPGGGVQSILVGENMLRGRKVAPGTPVVPVSGAGDDNTASTGISSRSSTPKPNRFKSAPGQSITALMQQGTVGPSVGPAQTSTAPTAGVSRSSSLVPAEAKARSSSADARDGRARGQSPAENGDDGENTGSRSASASGDA